MNLVRDVGLVLAPYGNRFEMSYAHFYGSFLLGLCLDSDNLNPPSMRLHDPTPVAPAAAHSPSQSNGAHDLLSLGGDLWPGPGGSGSQAAMPGLFPLVDMSPTEFLNPLLSADQLGPLLGLDAGASFDFELPWDVQQGATNSDTNAVSPPLEWLFNDSVTAGGGGEGDLGEVNTQQLWGFGLWGNADG